MCCRRASTTANAHMFGDVQGKKIIEDARETTSMKTVPLLPTMSNTNPINICTMMTTGVEYVAT